MINSKIFDTASTNKITFMPYRFAQVDTAPGADTTAPAKVALTLDTGVANQIKLSWSIPATNEETNGGSVGFNGLNIFRMVNTPDTTNWHNSALLVKQTTSTETFWIDTNVSGGNTYRYRVTSKDSAVQFNESFFTDTKSTAPADPNPPGLIQLFDNPSDTQPSPDVTPGDTMLIRVIDTGANTSGAVLETVTIRIKNTVTNEQETAVLSEKDTDDAIFELNFRFSANPADNASGSGRLYVLAGDSVQFDYTDPADATDTKTVTKLAGAVLDGGVRSSDTEIRQGDTAVIYAGSMSNPSPIDNAGATDTVTGATYTFIGIPDTYVVLFGARLWIDSGVLGKLEPAVDSLKGTATIIGGACTFSMSSVVAPEFILDPGDTVNLLVTIQIIDTVPVGETLDVKLAKGAVVHALGGLYPDSEVNSPGELAVRSNGPKILVSTLMSTTSAPVTYSGPAGDTVPGATLTIELRYDNDGGETAVNYVLSAHIPANTQLGTGIDSPSAAALMSPHTGAVAAVTITDDSGVVVADTHPAASRLKWTFTTGVAPNNGDGVGSVDASAADVDAGIVKYKVYIK